MKKTIAKVLSMLMALTLVIGLMAPATSALSAEPQETIHYVSLGDSMSNGYGFVGYEQGGTEKPIGKYDFLNGVGVYGQGAYPLQFEKYLKDEGYNVTHTKLGLSAMLPEDLLFLLGGRDSMPKDAWGGFNDYVGTYQNQWTVLKNHFQTAITNADIVTMGLGNASFGAFLTDKAAAVLGVPGSTQSTPVTLEDALNVPGLTEQQKQLVLDVYNQMKTELMEQVPAQITAQYNLDVVCDLVAYTTASFVVSYKACLDQMVTMNPDVKIILVGLMNTTYGINITMNDGSAFALGDMMDKVFSALNAYIAGLPAYLQAADAKYAEAEFYYAEQPNPLFISQQFAALKAAKWGDIDDGRLSGQIVRERTITSYNEMLRGVIGGAVNQDLPEITLADVRAYEANPPEWGADNNKNKKNTSVAIYLGIEDAVAASTQTMDIPLSGLMKIAGDLSSTFSGFVLDRTSPETLHTGLATYLKSTDEMMGMCKVYALFKIGNGMSVHPTPSGHDQIFKAVKTAYETGHTAKDETIDNAIAALQTAAALIAEYYDEAYAYGYEYAVKEGYIDAAAAAIDEAIKNLKALDLSTVEMTDAFRVKLEAEMAAVVATLESAKTAVQNVPTVDALLAAAQQMNDELYQHLLNIQAMGTQAGVDLTELAIIPAVEKAMQIVETKLIPAAQAIIEQANAYLSQKLGQAYDRVVEQVKQILSKYVPDAEAWVDKWLDKNVEIKTQLEELKAQLDALRAELEQAIREGKQQLVEQIQKQIDQVVAETERLVREFVNGIFHAEYVVKEDSFYAAITGNTAGYAAAVADALGLDFATMDWNSIDIEALTKADLITIGFDEQQLYGFAADQVLGYIASYAEANIRESLKAYMNTALTEGIGNVLTDSKVQEYTAMVDTYLNQILASDLFAGKTVQTLEWSNFLGENAAYVDQVRAELTKAMAENEIPTTYVLQLNLIDYLEQMEAFKDINWNTVRNNLGDKAIYTIELPVAEFADLFAESLLYSIISFHVEYANTIETITQVNPSAAVLLLNHVNTFNGLTLTIDNCTIELGKIYDVVAQVASAHSALQAVTKENVVYVDVRQAQTIFGQLVETGAVENTLENLALTVLEYGNVLTASESGNAYMAQQIINALDERCGHRDSDNDHYCDRCDEKLSNCVDSDGDYKCDICGKSLGSPVVPPAPPVTPTNPCEKGHDWNEGKVTTEATCTAEGVKTFTCSVCKKTKTEAIAKKNHSYDDGKVTTEATCTAEGVKTFTCSVCEQTKTEAIAKTDHSWVDATCTEAKTCSVCKATEGSAKGHSWTDATCTEAKTCSVCKATEGNAKGHSWMDATCTEAKTCSVCKATEGNAKGHSWMDATCTEAKTCSVCKATEGTALGHKYANACDADCDVCGEKRTPAAHDYGEWTVVTEATEKAEGKRERKCSVCGNVESEVIPMLEKSGMSTGAIVAISAVAVIAGGSTGAFFFLKKKKF